MNLSYIANEIKNSVETAELFEHYGFNPNNNGFICCPFRSEKTASMKIYKGNGGYHCFGCGEHGSIIDFVMRYFNLTFKEAIVKINIDFSLGLPIGDRLSLRQVREIERKHRERKEEKERWKAEHDRLTYEYWKSFDFWKKCDENIRKFRPRLIDDNVDVIFWEAIKNINLASYELDIAEMRLREHEHRRC